MPTPKRSKSPKVDPGTTRISPKDARKAADREVAAKAAPSKLEKIPAPSDVGYWGPSSADTLAKCPSWVGEPREDQDTTAADDGTLMHEACEKEDVSGLKSEEQVNLVTLCLEYVKTLKREGDKFYREEKWPITLQNAIVKRNGKMDLIIVHRDDTADVVDFKFGAIPVTEAEKNRQGWCYAIIATQKFPKLKMARVHFLQPKTDTITFHEFTRGDTQKRLATLTLEYRQTQLKPDIRPHVPGEHCQYCGRLAVCPAVAKQAKKIAEQYEPEAAVEFDEYHPSTVVDMGDLAAMLSIAKVLGKWAGSVKEHAKQYLLAGQDVPGWKLTEKAGSAGIPDDQTEAVWNLMVNPQPVLDAKGKPVKGKFHPPIMDVTQFLLCCSVSYTKILDAYASLNEGRLPSSKAKAEIGNKLAEKGLVVWGPTSFYPSKD